MGLGSDQEKLGEEVVGKGKKANTSVFFPIILPLEDIFGEVWLVFNEYNIYTNKIIFRDRIS